MTTGTPSPVLANLVRSAQALHRAGRIAEAEEAYAQIVRANPKYADGWFLFGTAALQSGRHADAVERLQHAARLDSRSASFLFNLGLAYQGLGQLDGAAGAFRKALRLDGKLPELHNGMGVILKAQGKAVEAAAAFRRAIDLRPAYALAHYNLGTVLKDQGQYAEAATSFRAGARLNPGFAQAHANLGVMLQELGDVGGAGAAYEEALALNPAEPETLNNLATLRRDSGDLAVAETLFAQAIEARPSFAEAHRNLGLLRLLQGNFAAGWPDYAWRWQCPDLASAKRPFTQPLWEGQPLSAGALLVWGEQGVGDEILYAGLMQEMAQRGFPVLWEADARLVSLLRRSCPAVEIIPRSSHPDPRAAAARAQIPAGGLGQYLRRSGADFPARPTGYLEADRVRSADLRTRLGLAPGERLVGLSWRSRNPVFGDHKSTRLTDWAPVLGLPGIRFVDLQYGDTQAERESAAAAGLNLLHVARLDLRDDIDGLAALIAACDAVVTVSNTTAHLTGALGRPVWVLVPAGAGKLWYWGHQGETTPLYSSARIVRQSAAGDWEGPIAQAARELQQFLR